MISLENTEFLRRAVPEFERMADTQIPAAAASHMNRIQPFLYDDFETCDDVGVIFTWGGSGYGFKWEGQEVKCIPNFIQMVATAAEQVRGNEYRFPEVRELRSKGWRIKTFGTEGAVYLANQEDERVEPLFASAGAAWAAMVRRVKS